MCLLCVRSSLSTAVYGVQVYDRIAIRLVFPGRERLILQANFAPSEPARAVAAVLRAALRGGDACAERIELYTTPPRTVLDLESERSLLDLGFAPAARVNVAASTIVHAADGAAGDGSFEYLSAPLRAQVSSFMYRYILHANLDHSLTRSP